MIRRLDTYHKRRLGALSLLLRDLRILLAIEPAAAARVGRSAIALSGVGMRIRGHANLYFKQCNQGFPRTHNTRERTVRAVLQREDEDEVVRVGVATGLAVATGVPCATGVPVLIGEAVATGVPRAADIMDKSGSTNRRGRPRFEARQSAHQQGCPPQQHRRQCQWQWAAPRRGVANKHNVMRQKWEEVKGRSRYMTVCFFG